MVAIPLDKINYNKLSKYANVLIFKEFCPKTKNVSYYLKHPMNGIKGVLLWLYDLHIYETAWPFGLL